MEGGRTKLESWSQTLGAGGRGVMRAAGGLTLRRGESTASPSSGPAKMVTVSVVGLSGGEKEKGSMGSGKSCLCNRFVAPLADDYNIDHISVLSQSDFSGRVVNNDHFLYWGDILKTNEDGVDFHVQVVEQTEFIDDTSFQPFRSSGKQEPYIRRCASTRVVSAEKLMYICKNQLGLEKEFDEKVMPDGRLNIDGFICVFDVSLVPNRTLEKQVETTVQILLSLMKTKKPIVLVTTKNDEGNELFVREADRLINRKEFRGLVPLVETSSHENINVDSAFFLLASLIDRSRGRVRVLSYAEARNSRREMVELASEQFARLVRAEVTDYGASWTVVSKKLGQYQEFQNFVDIFGLDAALRIFKRHVKKLKDTFLSDKVARYLELLPEVLHELFPDIDSLGDEDWVLIQQKIKQHPDFDRWFVEYPEDTTWMEANLFDGDSSEHRIPFDVLDSTEAETVYKNLLNQLHADQKRTEIRQSFKDLLEETGYVTPGKKLDEVRVLFLGRECYEALTEEERHQIYEIHQQDLIQRCKRNFQELLLEKADIFYQFRSSPAGTVTHDDIVDITEAICEDGRYKVLDRMDADRKLLLFQHLGFVHCPLREHCPAYPQCTDCLVERLVSRRAASRPVSWGGNSNASSSLDTNQLKIVILGDGGLSSELSQLIHERCPKGEFEHGGQMFYLELTEVSGNASLPQNAFRAGSNSSGCFCVYSELSSLEYIRSSLETTLLANLEKEDRLPFQGVPLVILFQPDPSLGEKEILFLQNEGQNLADSLQAPFIESNQGENEVVTDSLRSLVECIRCRSTVGGGALNIYPPGGDGVPNPDIRVIMCLFCGDPFSIDKVLGPLLGSKSCIQTGVRSVLVEADIRGSPKKVEVILSSYHSATDFRDELVHGFVLVFSTKRKASLATLSAFSMNIPELPIEVVGVMDTHLEANHITQSLNMEGNLLANQLNAHFVTANLSQPNPALYTHFFQEVLDKKAEIEKAFALDDKLSGRLDDSGEGTLERPVRRNPMPPPRIDSYPSKQPSSLNSRSGSGRSGSGSEIYERLPDSGSQADIRSNNNNSEDSDIYSQVDSLDRQGGGGGGSLHGRKMNGTASNKHHPHKYIRKQGPDGSPPTGQIGGLPPPTVPPPPRPKFNSNNNNNNNSLKGSSSSPPPAAAAGPGYAAESPGGGGAGRNRDQQRVPPAYMGSRGGGTTTTFVGSTFIGGSPSSVASSGGNDLDTAAGGGQMLTRIGSGGGTRGGTFLGEQRIGTGGSFFGWTDDTNLAVKRSEHAGEIWGPYTGAGGAYTTGRRAAAAAGGGGVPRERQGPPSPPPPPAPAGGSGGGGAGKLNMADFNHVSAALNRLQVKPHTAPLATDEDLDRDNEGGYAVPRDTINAGSQSEYAQPMLTEGGAHRPGKPRSKNRERRERQARIDMSDSESDLSSDERPKKPPTGIGKRPRKRRGAGSGGDSVPALGQQMRGAIPVATPQVPKGLPKPQPRLAQVSTEVTQSPEKARTEETTLSSPREDGGPTDKQKKRLEKELKLKQKEMAKQEKKEREREEKESKAKMKEEKRKEKQDKKLASRQGIKANSVQGNVSLDDFRASDDNPVPAFLSRTIEFIEREGLDAEGLYRVPGNRAHVELLFAKFDDDKNVDLASLDIAVNAVATAVKDFFFKRLPPLLPPEHMTDLESISVMSDRHMKLLELKKLLERLPKSNYAVLKYIFQHFVRVTERSKENCMDSKNLAICWWPTLLQYEFGDLAKFEMMRPHLEDVVQTLIDQYRFLFCGQEEVMMV